jgi:hypothetical protein
MKTSVSFLTTLFALVSSLIVGTASDAHAGGITGRLCESLTNTGGCVNPITVATLYFYNLEPNYFQITGFAGTTATNSGGSFGKTLADGLYWVQVGYEINGVYYSGHVQRIVTVANNGYTNIGNKVPYAP